jgi:hypothetical protein
LVDAVGIGTPLAHALWLERLGNGRVPDLNERQLTARACARKAPHAGRPPAQQAHT